MFDYLSGKIVDKKPTLVVLDVGGVGYAINIPLSTYEQLPAEGVAKLFVSLKVTDEEIKLYGFATLEERELFESMTSSVQRLGPAKALTILSNARIDEIISAIYDEDVRFLKKIKGLGEKLAHRLIIELKGKLPSKILPEELKKYSMKTRDAIQALITLGYNKDDAEQVVVAVQKSASKDMPLEELVRVCLDRLR